MSIMVSANVLQFCTQCLSGVPLLAFFIHFFGFWIFASFCFKLLAETQFLRSWQGQNTRCYYSHRQFPFIIQREAKLTPANEDNIREATMEGLTNEEIKAHNLQIVHHCWDTMEVFERPFLAGLVFSCQVEGTFHAEDANKCPFRPMTLQPSKQEKQTLICLGVPKDAEAKGFISRCLDPNTAYGQLPRSTCLPGPCPITMEDVEEATHEYMTKLWNGDFDFNIISSSESFVLVASVQEDVQYLIDFSLLEDDRTLVRANGIDECLDERKQTLLATRVMHHFIRQFGWKIQPELLAKMISSVSAAFHGKKKYLPVLLDLCIIETDLALNIPSMYNGAEVGNVMCAVGKILQAMGRFVQASKIYQEVAQITLVHSPDSEDIAHAHSNTGDALLNSAGRPEESLEFLLKAVHFSTSNASGWSNVNSNPDTNMKICSPLQLQHNIYQKSLQARPGKGLTKLNSDNKLSVGLTGLLSFANFVPSDNQSMKLHLENFCQRQGLAVAKFRPQHLNPKKATKLLFDIFRSGSTENYKAGVLGAIPKDTFVHSVDVAPAATEKDHKRHAHARLSYDKHFCCACCCEKEKEGQKHLSCPCHQVNYCSKTCQTNGWKQHKLRCAWQKDKVKAKEAAK